MRSVEAGGCYKLPGDECDNTCQNTAPILAWAESRSLPIFPCSALSHLMRSWSGYGWVRGNAWWILITSSTEMSLFLPYDWVWKGTVGRNLRIRSQSPTITVTVRNKLMWPFKVKICRLSGFSESANNFLGQHKACLHTFNRNKLVGPNDSSKVRGFI